jgi:hypothetical protein
MGRQTTLTRRAPLLALVALIAIGLAAGTTGPAGAMKKKVKNPLAGRYAGTTEEGGTVSFAITNAGRVVNFTAGPTTLVCPQPSSDPSQPPPPNLVLTTSATVTAATPIPLRQPAPGYPKGKRFDYTGPGGSPAGTADIHGKLAVGFRGMEGSYYLKRVQSGALTCRMRTIEESGGIGLVSWDARKRK